VCDISITLKLITFLVIVYKIEISEHIFANIILRYLEFLTV